MKIEDAVTHALAWTFQQGYQPGSSGFDRYKAALMYANVLELAEVVDGVKPPIVVVEIDLGTYGSTLEFRDHVEFPGAPYLTKLVILDGLGRPSKYIAANGREL